MTREVEGGFEDRFRVTRTDGKPCRPEARYFVLDYAGDRHAKMALLFYADSVGSENMKLAADLRDAIMRPEDYPAQHDGVTDAHDYGSRSLNETVEVLRSADLPPRGVEAVGRVLDATKLECIESARTGLSEQLRRQLHADGLSLRDVAPKIGVSFSTLGRLLRGGAPLPRNRKKVEQWLAKRVRARHDQLSQGDVKCGS